MNYREINKYRRATRDYDPGFKVSRETLLRLFNEAALAPSSYNVQGYKIVAITSEEAKKRLHPVAMKQPQVLTASAMLIVLGNLEAYKGLRHILEQSAGVDPATIGKAAEGQARFYGGNAQLARDEAIRSASLFAMNFMLAAANEGLDTGPMIGFDPQGVCREFGIEHPYFPAMMISVGKAKSVPGPRGYRIPSDEFTRFE